MTPWKILVVDDEQIIHDSIEINIQDLTHNDRPVELIHAYSQKEAQQILGQTPDIAVVILDVMMERDDAGLDFVKFVREEVKNRDTRILLHTGQPGIAPKRKVSEEYIIDGYLDKNSADSDDVYAAVQVTLRAYEEKRNLKSRAVRDDVSLLEKIADIYIDSLSDQSKFADLQTAQAVFNRIVPLCEELNAYYDVVDIKSGDHFFSSKEQRMPYKDYKAIVQIYNIRNIIKEFSEEEYQSQKEEILSMINSAVKNFSNIKILPNLTKERLQTCILS